MAHDRILRMVVKNLPGSDKQPPFSYLRLLQGPYIDAMAMFDKLALTELGMYYQDLPLFRLEDYELWLRIGKAGKYVTYIQLQIPENELTQTSPENQILV